MTFQLYAEVPTCGGLDEPYDGQRFPHTKLSSTSLTTSGDYEEGQVGGAMWLEAAHGFSGPPRA